MQELVNNRANEDKALEHEFREALVTELSKTHKNVSAWCDDDDIVFETADKKLMRQVTNPGKLFSIQRKRSFSSLTCRWI